MPADFSPLVDEDFINRFLKLAPESVRERCRAAAADAAADPVAAQERLAREGLAAYQRAQAAVQSQPSQPPQPVQAAVPIQSPPAAESEKLGAVIQLLPRWVDEQRGAPNTFLRSALFGMVKRGRRKMVKEWSIATLGDIQMTYTGEQLDQSDLDVWLNILHLAQETQSLKIHFTAYNFLKQIDRKIGQSGYNWLHSSILRLKANAVVCQDQRFEYGGSLVNNYYLDKKNELWVVELNPELIKMFGWDSWTGIQRQERGLLKGDLAQWLHAFYSTHANPYPMKVQTLHGLCGSETGELWKFRQQLKLALTELSQVTGWLCRVDEKTDLCHVDKSKKITA